MEAESILTKLNEIALAVQNNYTDLKNRIESLEAAFTDKIKIIEENYSEDKNAIIIVSEKLAKISNDIGDLKINEDAHIDRCEKLNIDATSLHTSAIALDNICTSIRTHLKIIDEIKAQSNIQKQMLEEAMINPKNLGNVNKSGEVAKMSKEEYFIYCWSHNMTVTGKLDNKITEMVFRRLAPANADSLKGKLSDEKKIAKLFYKHITGLKNDGDMRSIKAIEFFDSVYTAYTNTLIIE